MRQYTKPSIDLYSVNTEHFLANSRSDNQITGDGDKTHIGGDTSESTDSGNTNGSVDDMAKKHYNAWDAWDD